MKWWLAAGSLLGLLSFLLVSRWTSTPHVPRKHHAQASAASSGAVLAAVRGARTTTVAQPELPPQPRAPVTTTAAWSAPDALAELRAELDVDPEQTLEDARSRQTLFLDDAQAAECQWVIVRALSRLTRAAEARYEAERLVKAHASSPFALDVTRHVLSVP
jgi:hypothetical protein